MTRAQCNNGLGLQVGDGYSRAGSPLGLLAGGLLGRGLLLDRLLGGHTSETHCFLCCCCEAGVSQVFIGRICVSRVCTGEGQDHVREFAKDFRTYSMFSTNRVSSIWGKLFIGQP